jgi:hypothetical protein
MWMTSKPKKSFSAVKDIEYGLNVVLPELRDLEVDSLIYSRLTKWRNELPMRGKESSKETDRDRAAAAYPAYPSIASNLAADNPGRVSDAAIGLVCMALGCRVRDQKHEA